MEANQEKMEIKMDTAIQDRMAATVKVSQEKIRPKMKWKTQFSPFIPN
jgi:hypothetical protein